MPPTLEQTRQAVDGYAAAQAKLTAALLRLLLGFWGSFVHWDSYDLVRAHAARSTVDVDVALAQARTLARAYMRSQYGQLGIDVPKLPDIVNSYERGGVEQLIVYQRPARERSFVERQALATGASPDEAASRARDAFVERMERIVEADIQATVRDELNKVMEATPAVTGYRRIIHPERSKTGTCGLCMVAADRIYSIAELMAIHDGCQCTVLPITSASDPGLALNREDLDALYAAAGGTGGDRLKNIRVTSFEHGELGPVLIRQGSKFRTLDEVNRDTNYSAKATPFKRQTRADDQTNWARMKETSERSIAYLTDAKSRGTNLVDLTGSGSPKPVKDIDAAIQYHRDLIARAARHAA
jgi:hypothetical protein